MTAVRTNDLDDSGQLAFLAEAGELLGTSLDYETTLASLAKLTVPYLADWCVVDIVDEDGSVRRLAVAHTDPSKVAGLTELQDRYPPNPESRHGVMQVIRTGQPEIAPEVREEWLVKAARDSQHLQALRELQLQSYICAPLVAGSRVFGALTLASANPARRYGPRDLAFVENLARRAAMAVDNARLYGDVKRASEIKDRLLRMLGHDLRSSVNITLGWLRLLRASNMDAGALERALSAIERTAQAEARMIEDIQDACSVVARELTLSPQPADLVALVIETIEEARPAAQAKHLQFELMPSSPPTCRVMADTDRLRRVFRHIVSNAIKFTPDGGRVDLWIDVSEGQVDVRCSDTGRGISAEFLPYVFDCFQQETSTRGSESGLGIGLTIARHLVELHGGRVKVESAGEGLGTTVTLQLPLVSAGSEPHAMPVSSSRSVPASPGVLAALRILVVEDEADAGELVAHTLQQQGATVTTATSAREALTLLRQSRHDVLVSDIGMPHEDGFALIRQVRKLPDERGGKIPAIAVTAYGGQQDRTRALLEGFQVHLSKPVRPSELISLIASVARR